MRWLAAVCFWTAVCATAWSGGLLWFASQIPNAAVDDPDGDAIVVLTGGPGRVEYGLQLLASGNGKALFVSGAGQNVTINDIARQAPAPARDAIHKMARQTIFLGNEAENTIGNAEETKRWLQDKNYNTVVLVTSAYHMPRSVSEFREALPDTTIVPAPVFSGDFKPQQWLTDRESRRLMLSEYHKYIASKLRHWFVSATQAP